MKKAFFLCALIFGTALCCFAGGYEDNMAKAESATNLGDRFEFWLKAADATSDAGKQLTAYQKGFDLAKKLKEQKWLIVFADKIGQCPAASKEQKAVSYYEFLMALPNGNWMNVGPDPIVYEKFLAMPGRTPEQEHDVKMKMTNVYHNHDQWYKEVALFKELLANPLTTDLQRQDLLINFSKLYLLMNDMKGSLDCLDQILAIKKLTPKRRADVLLIKGDTLLKGDGWYYMPSEEQYQAIKQCYLDVLKMDKASQGQYSQAILKLVEAAAKMKKHKEVIQLSEKYLVTTGKSKKRVDGNTWNMVKDQEGIAHMALEEFPAAVSVYETLYKYKYKLADTCMSLGQAFYRNKEYISGMGMYDEAIVELGKADDARPAQCKHWKNRLSGLISQQKAIEAAIVAHQTRLNDEAKAEGKGPVVEVKKKDNLRLFDTPKKDPKKKPQSMKDVMAEPEKDLLDEGLDLD